MSTAKAVVVVVWLLFLSSFFIETSSTVAWLGRLGFWLLVATHAVECVLFLPRLRSAPGSLAGHLIRTSLFGFLHVRELRSPANRDALDP